MNIPFLDLQRQYKTIKNMVNPAVNRVLKNQFFILSAELKKFEDDFANYLGVKHVVGLNSGTDALIYALRALNIGKGDEVITPTQSFIATTLAITEVGATPVFVDSDPKTYLIDTSKIEAEITKKTKAILPVHLFGAMCDMDKIMRLAKKHKLFVVEDACQAHGATFKNKKAGTFGDIGTFSFYPGKNLGAYGDAGAICTDIPELAQKIRMLGNYGQRIKYHHDTIGLNSRLDEIQAAVLSVKLPFLDRWHKKRNTIANLYNRLLHKTIKTQQIAINNVSAYHLFVIEVDDRDTLREYLEKKGIHTLIHYPVPIHLQKCYSNLGYKKGDFTCAEKNAERLLSLPIYPELTEKEVRFVANSVNQFYSL